MKCSLSMDGALWLFPWLSGFILLILLIFKIQESVPEAIYVQSLDLIFKH